MPFRWLLLVISLQASAQHYTPIDSLGSVKFVIKNFGVSVEGTLQGLRGDIFIDTAYPENSYFTIQLNANTIDTGINLRNKHLKKEDYLLSKNFHLLLSSRPG